MPVFLIAGTLLAGLLSPTALVADPTAAQCRSTSDRVLRSIVQTPALEGRFFRKAPSLRLVRYRLPDNETETWENYTYENADGHNSVTVKLARGLCELRQVIHNVPL